MSHYNASIQQSSKEPEQHKAKTDDKIEILETVFFIKGHNGIILDVLYTQGKAIKTFIMDYKDRVVEATLVAVQGGKQYTLKPTGTVTDYR